jgi:hypothetical protein
MRHSRERVSAAQRARDQCTHDLSDTGEVDSATAVCVTAHRTDAEAHVTPRRDIIIAPGRGISNSSPLHFMERTRQKLPATPQCAEAIRRLLHVPLNVRFAGDCQLCAYMYRQSGMQPGVRARSAPCTRRNPSLLHTGYPLILACMHTHRVTAGVALGLR